MPDIPIEERVVFRGNEIVIQLWKFFDTFPSDHASTLWVFTNTVDPSNAFTITTTASGVVSDLPIAEVSYGTLVELRIALDRTKDWHFQAILNNNIYSEQVLLDLQPRMLSAKHRTDSSVTATRTGATVSTSSPRWTETQTSDGRVIISNQVYADEPASNRPTESRQGNRVVINNNVRNPNKGSLTDYSVGTLVISSSSNLDASGTEGGPFSSTSITYTLSSTGTFPINWTAEKSQSWVVLSKTSGTIFKGETDTITVSLSADLLTPDSYSDTIIFTNTTSGSGTTTRTVSLTVNPLFTAMTTAVTTSGTAPLGVLFDATVEDCGVEAPTAQVDGVTNFNAHVYTWDFGDPKEESDPICRWSTGRKKDDGYYPTRNEAIGYVAAHVYEVPGTYTAQLTVTDENGYNRYYTQTITVSAFSGTTYYVSSTGLDTNNGLSPETSFLTINKGVSVLGAGKRLLVNRGDTFSLTSTAFPPNYSRIEAYGTGADPILQPASGAVDTLIYNFGNTDFIIQGIQFECGYNTVGLYGCTNMTAIRLVVNNAPHGAGDWYGHNMFLIDSVITEAQTVSMYSNAYQIAILGDTFDRAIDQHNLYLGLSQAVISSNNVWKPATGDGGEHCLRIAPRNPGPGRSIVTTYNDFDATTTWLAVQMAISSGTWDLTEHNENVLFEKNTVLGRANTIGVQTARDYRNIEIRNNEFTRSTTPDVGAIIVDVAHDAANLVDPAYDGPRGFRFHDNTLVANGTWYRHTSTADQETYVYNNTVNGVLDPGTPPA